jgi:carboxyl-terminal processing protease
MRPVLVDALDEVAGDACVQRSDPGFGEEIDRGLARGVLTSLGSRLRGNDDGETHAACDNRRMKTHPSVLLIVALFLAVAAPLAAQDAVKTPEEQATEAPKDPVPAPDPAKAAPAAAPTAPAEPGPDAAKAAKEADAVDPKDKVSLEEIRRFVSVFRAVKQAYVDPVDDEKLMRAAIRGLLNDLDPHSAYLDRDESVALNEQASGAYDGLGVEVLQQVDRTLLVIAPIDDTPAARAGIKTGDVITHVNGKPIAADSVDGAIDTMRGEPGTPITLTVERENAAAPLQFTLVRETIRVSSVRVRDLEPGYAYLRISTFQADTGTEVTRKLEALKAKGKTPLRGLVMDLRSNPGGLLNAAVEVADAFLDGGVIVSTKGRLPYSNAEFKARRGDLLDGAPIVILADSGTASAAEVLAGALRDHQRALVMGSPSFGKGSVQTVLPMDNGDSLKMTTARYYTPSGVSIQASGIVPDVELPENASLAAGDRAPTVRERDLPGHLKGDFEGTQPLALPNATPVTAPAPEAEEKDDFAVREALNLLKGLVVFGDKKRVPKG